MSDLNKYLADKRFEGIKPFDKKVWLSSPTMHGEEIKYIQDAYDSNWMTTIGENINEVERIVSEKIGTKYCVGLSSGTSGLHLAIKLAGEKLYGQPENAHDGYLQGHKVFCSDMTFAATLNAVAYENGEAVFIDTEYDTWNMDPKALERAFELYPDVKLVVMVHLYGVPGKMDELLDICKKHGALVVEDAAESFGATYKGTQTGCFGYPTSVISFNGNKIITGSTGGALLTDDEYSMNKVRKWSTQSRETAPWYQHEEIGYNYRMSNVVAGVIRGQLPYLEEHIAQKKAIYKRYKEGLKDLPITMNPYDEVNSEPIFWLSCLTINKEAMCEVTYGDTESTYNSESGKSCPTEILEALAAFNAEGRPIWKPMHKQPVYRNNAFVACEDGVDNGWDIFERGLCLPSDNKMTKEEQDIIIDIIHRCFE